MPSNSRHGSHSYSSSSHGHSSRSRSGRDDYQRGPPSSGLFSNLNPFGGGSSSRRPSARGLSPERYSSRSYRERSPAVSSGRPSSSRRADERPMFSDPFGSSSSRYADPFGSSRHSSSRSGSRSGYVDMSFPPPTPGRRGAHDHSNTAADFYDPFAGELGTGGARSYSIRGDPELPAYRSASEYARGSASRPPGYDVRGSSLRGSNGPPPYSSFSSSQGGYGAPMQFPPTRRPSHYDRGDGLPPADYFTRKYR